MSIHRYTPQAVDAIMHRAAVTMAALPIVIVLGALLMIWLANRGEPIGAAHLVAMAILAPIVFWSSWNQRAKTRDLVRSTEVEFDGDELTARNAQLSVTISREEVREVRRLADGLMVRGTDIRKMIVLKDGLEDFESLAAEVNAWVPAEVRRSAGADTTGLWVWGLMAAGIILAIAAFGSNDSLVGGGASLLLGLLLIACLLPSWLSTSGFKVDPKFRRLTLVTALPIFALFYRGYLLLSGQQ